MISTQRIESSKNKLVTVLQVPNCYFRFSHIFSFIFSFFTFLLLSGCGPASNNENFKKLSTEEQIKFQKYYIQGKNLYLANCSTCHQKNGLGVKKLIPPLAGSDYLKNNQKASLQLIQYGASKPIAVNNQSYPATMPAHPHLSNLEIAELMTYINNAWGNAYGFVDGKDIAGTPKH